MAPGASGAVAEHCGLWCRLHFFGQRILTACYAHAWDPSGTRIFMCGGPLAYGLRGNYAALWH